MNLKPEIYNQLRKYSKTFTEEEVCGFIVEDQGFVKFISIENKHPEKNAHVLISPKDYLSIKIIIKYYTIFTVIQLVRIFQKQIYFIKNIII
jgi:proteasome lid subunit RPN8/RPN11